MGSRCALKNQQNDHQRYIVGSILKHRWSIYGWEGGALDGGEKNLTRERMRKRISPPLFYPYFDSVLCPSLSETKYIGAGLPVLLRCYFCCSLLKSLHTCSEGWCETVGWCWPLGRIDIRTRVIKLCTLSTDRPGPSIVYSRAVMWPSAYVL